MKKKKTSELEGSALDWAVAKSEGRQVVFNHQYTEEIKFDGWWQLGPNHWQPLNNYSTNWAQGGQIIEREIGNIWKHNKLNPWDHDVWTAVAYHKNPDGTSLYYEDGPTALIAAMRCYVSLKLGDEVDLPEELCAL